MTGQVASLGMYDRPELRPANDALWSAIAARLSAAGVAGVPPRLDRGRPLDEIWDDPALLLAQTCGYPMVTRWRGRLRYVATPRYAVAGCEGGAYRARFVVRREDRATSLAGLRGGHVAINEPLSNSGMNLLRAAIAPLAKGRRFFSAVSETGSHAASARLVATGGADLAAIDTVTFAHLERYEPGITAGLRTLAWSPAVPGLPFVTSAAASPATVALLRRTLAAVIADPQLAEARDALQLDGIGTLPASRYERIGRLEAAAVRAGYPVLG